MPKSAGSETILLVEDEDAVRVLERGALTGAGYRVLEAGNGDEAVALFEARATEIDMLVTDIVMAGMSGRELADRLRSRVPDSRCSTSPATRTTPFYVMEC